MPVSLPSALLLFGKPKLPWARCEQDEGLANADRGQLLFCNIGASRNVTRFLGSTKAKDYTDYIVAKPAKLVTCYPLPAKVFDSACVRTAIYRPLGFSKLGSSAIAFRSLEQVPCPNRTLTWNPGPGILL